MEFTRDFLPGVRSGAITMTLRRWRSPLVRAGSRYRRPRLGGVLAVDAIEPVDVAAVDDATARGCGFADAASARAFLDRLGPPSVPTYLVRFHLEPAAALPSGPLPAPGEVASRLKRMDGDHPWTHRVLGLIGKRPAVRAADLAAAMGQDTARFKTNVRRLKALGLVESLEVGYRLTDRGHEVVGEQAGSG